MRVLPEVDYPHSGKQLVTLLPAIQALSKCKDRQGRCQVAALTRRAADRHWTPAWGPAPGQEGRFHPAVLWGAGPTHWPETGSAHATAPAQGRSLGAGTDQEHLACRDRPGKNTSLGTFVIPPNLCNKTVLLSSNISKEKRKAFAFQLWTSFHCENKSARLRLCPSRTKVPLRPQQPATAAPHACTMTPSRPPDLGAVSEPPASWDQTTLTKHWRRKGQLHKGRCPDRGLRGLGEKVQSPAGPWLPLGISILPPT